MGLILRLGGVYETRGDSGWYARLKKHLKALHAALLANLWTASFEVIFFKTKNIN